LDKKILDACCGSRMFWFDKQNKDVLYIDKRYESLIAKDSSCKSGERIIDVFPDVVCDFTEMPFENESFYLVVFDPPHLKTLGKTSWLAKK
jgi:ubiquinone/menaquinone biosynthesis C-methylase UbiE